MDQMAIEQFGMPGVVLMENAGRGAALKTIEVLGGSIEGRRIAIACGGGNNGGDGFVIARHLHNAGAAVTIFLAAHAEQIRGDAAVHYRIARQMGLPLVSCMTAGQVEQAVGPLRQSDCIIDALLGTGFSGQVRSPLAELIEQINAAALHGTQVVAVDVPSGLDCDSGTAAGTAVRAGLTVTFVAPKVGLLKDTAARYVGRIAVVDIGVPREIVPGE